MTHPSILPRGPAGGKPPRWDLQAERFSAAITLYQMARGFLPVWHDGKTDSTMVDCEVTIDADHFGPNLRDRLSEFFRRALRRNPPEQFDNALRMLEEWQSVFRTTTITATGAFYDVETDNSALPAEPSIQSWRSSDSDRPP